MRRFLIWLSGESYELLERCPNDRPKYEGIGSAVLITSTMAGISMTFALNTALKVVLPVAMACGLGWGLAIMRLDQWLVSSIQRRERPWQNVGLAVPRLVLAVLFGLVISTPLVLQIFKPEIEVQVVQIQENQANQFRKDQEQGDVGKEIGALQRRVQQLQGVLASGGDQPIDPASDPKVAGLTKQRSAEQAIADKRLADWRCERYGPCKHAGPGPVADQKFKRYQEAQRSVDDLNGQIGRRERQLTAEDASGKQQRVAAARAALPDAQEELRTLQRQQNARQEAFEANNRASKGLLIRLQALDQVSAKNNTMRSAQVLLLLFITAIECLPVIVKLLHTLGPPNNYERLRARQDRQVLTDDVLGRGTGLDDIWDSGAGGPASGTRPMDSAPGASETGESGDEARGRQPPDSWEDEKLRNMRDDFIDGDAGYAPEWGVADISDPIAPPHPVAPAHPTVPDDVSGDGRLAPQEDGSSKGAGGMMPAPGWPAADGELFPRDPDFIDDHHDPAAG